MDPLMSPVLELSASQLVSNVAAVRTHIAPSALMLAMKDDAYGHGVDWVLEALRDDAELTRFGSYDIDTGTRIRARRADARVFAWATSTADEVVRGLEAGIDLGVGSREYLDLVIAAARQTGLVARVHLKIDTGLHRSGVRPEDWHGVVAAAVEAEHAGLLRVVGVWSHLAEASDAEDDEAAAEFRRAVDELRRQGLDPHDLHLTASAASWWRPELRGTVSRIGAFCYGIRSAEGPEVPGIRPVATLRARVTDVHADSVEIGIGALHGLPSILTGATVGTPEGPRKATAIRQARTAVESWRGAAVGDAVNVFGPGGQGEGDATGLAERIDTVGEEIVTRLTSAVKRVATR